MVTVYNLLASHIHRPALVLALYKDRHIQVLLEHFQLLTFVFLSHNLQPYLSSIYKLQLCNCQDYNEF